MTIRFVVGEVALEPLDVAITLEREDVRRDAIEEPAIVADHDRAAREPLEAVLERAQRVDVEVVRRLVEQEEIAGALDHLREVDAVALTAGEDADPLLLILTLEVEARDVRARRDRLLAHLEVLDAFGDLVEDRLRSVERIARLVDVTELDGIADRDLALVG